ncbi:MAG: DNA-directed RNA polymerase II core subunit [Candelina mexicana]|nr:MAG: DNA-directed RNA polymerase II core subunit [Candelina mexicana]
MADPIPNKDDPNKDHLKETPKPYVADHMPDRFELFLLGEGERKVTVTPDTRIPSSAIFVFQKEDHTLGNMLRSRLLSSPHVLFSAYKVPHPLIASFELRVQTDGEITPTQAVVQASKDIVNDLSVLGRRFTEEWELFKAAKGGQGQ